MRLLFAMLSLAIAVVSLTLDAAHPPPDSRLCAEGVCRYDQIFAAVDAQGMNLENISALLNLDPSNPSVWCTYGELATAASAFDQAIILGPEMPAVQMRAANFDFTHGRADHGFVLTNKILSETYAFDEPLFSYLTRSGLPVSSLAGVAVPAEPRASTSWFVWLRTAGSDTDLRELWSWMRENRLLDQKLATDFAWAFWQRKAFAAAQETWVDWLGSANNGYLHPQLIANVRFRNVPDGSPFDWTLVPIPGAEIRQEGGLEIRFAGTENVAFSNVHQFTVVRGGRYRFSAEISADNVTTEQGPFFHIFDPVSPGGLSVESASIKGTVARSWITMDVPVPAGTHALQIQIERRPAQKFDNKIGGTLHVYQVSLLPG
jgi:hypothetical protein